MTTHKEALTLALEALKELVEKFDSEQFTSICELDPAKDAIAAAEEALANHIPDATKMVAQPEQPKQNTVEAVKAILKGIDQTEIESPDGWWETSAGAEFGAKKLKYVVGLLAQPEQEPVAWRYKPAREDNPRWEYTTNHPLDMGDGYIRPSLVEYCKCIEPLYAKEKPKLMLEKFREMEDLLEEPAQQEPATKEKIREAIVFNLPLYTTLPQRKPLTDEQIAHATAPVFMGGKPSLTGIARAIEAAHGIKEQQ